MEHHALLTAHRGQLANRLQGADLALAAITETSVPGTNRYIVRLGSTVGIGRTIDSSKPASRQSHRNGASTAECSTPEVIK
jgi:hypothetical protein